MVSIRTTCRIDVQRTQRSHVVAAADRQEADERDLHAGQRAQCVPGRVADVQPGAEPSHADEDEGVQGQHVGDEDVSTPRADHVSVEQGTQASPHHTALFDRLDPQVEGEDQQEDCNGLVVVAARNRAGDVSRCDAHECSGHETGRGRRAHLSGDQVGSERSQAGEAGCKEHTDVADVDRDGEEAEEVVDDAGGDHEAWVEGATGNTAEGMPCSCRSSMSTLFSSTTDVLTNRVGAAYGHRTNPRTGRSHCSRGTLSL